MAKSKASKLADETHIIDDPDNEPQDIEAQDTPQDLDPEPEKSTAQDVGAHARWEQAKADLQAARETLAALEVEDNTAQAERIERIAQGEKLTPAEHIKAIAEARSRRAAEIEAAQEVITGLEQYEQSLRLPAMDDLRAQTAGELQRIAKKAKAAAGTFLDLWTQTRAALADLDALFEEHTKTARAFDAEFTAAGTGSGVPWPNDAVTRWTDWPVNLERIAADLAICGDPAKRGRHPSLSVETIIRGAAKAEPQAPAIPFRDPRLDDPDVSGGIQFGGGALESEEPPREFLEHPERFHGRKYDADGNLLELQRENHPGVYWRRVSSAA